VCSADLQLSFRLGRFNNLTNACLKSEVRKEAMNLSYKKDGVQDSNFSEDQCQTGVVVVMEFIVKKLDKLFNVL